MKRDIAEEEVKRAIEGVRQFKVHSVTFDQQPTEKVIGRRTALVRLEPLPLPWASSPDNEVCPYCLPLSEDSDKYILSTRISCASRLFLPSTNNMMILAL